MNKIMGQDQRIILIDSSSEYATKDLKKLITEYKNDLDNHFRIDEFLLLNEEDMNAFYKPFPGLLNKGIKQYKTGTFRYDSRKRIRIPAQKKIPIFSTNKFNKEDHWKLQLNNADIMASIDYVVLTSIKTLTDKELKGDGYLTRQEALEDNQKYYPRLNITSPASFYAFKEIYANMDLKQKREFLGLDQK